LRILLTYIVNGHPKSIHVSRTIDPLVSSIVGGGVLLSCSQVEHIASGVDGYIQEDEKLLEELKEKWQPVELPAQFVQAISLHELGLDVERR
jgi:hypothetical protein